MVLCVSSDDLFNTCMSSEFQVISPLIVACSLLTSIFSLSLMEKNEEFTFLCSFYAGNRICFSVSVQGVVKETNEKNKRRSEMKEKKIPKTIGIWTLIFPRRPSHRLT